MAAEPEAPGPVPYDMGPGGNWLTNAKKRKKRLKREDDEIIALVKALAPDLMSHHRRLH